MDFCNGFNGIQVHTVMVVGVVSTYICVYTLSFKIVWSSLAVTRLVFLCTRPVQFSIVHLGGLGRQQGAKFRLSTFLKTCFAHGMHIYAVSDMSSSKFFGSCYPWSFFSFIVTGWH